MAKKKTAGTKTKRTRRNPPLVVFANPRGGLCMSREVIQIAYRHADDGKLYRHEFARGVHMQALPDGSLHIHAAGNKRLWGEYDA